VQDQVYGHMMQHK